LSHRSYGTPRELLPIAGSQITDVHYNHHSNQKVGTEGRYRTDLSYLLELAGGAGVPAKKDENWLSLVKSHLEDLRALTGFSASLCMPSGKDMIYVLQILGREGLAVNNPPGTRRPVHCTAVGKAYLGLLPAAELNVLLGTLNLRSFTNRTITSPRSLKQHLREAGRRGYYIDDCEFDLRIRCVASAVLDAFGHAIGSIGVAGVKSDPAFGRIHELGPLIAEKAKGISRALGYDPNRRDSRLQNTVV
jgi:IclR family acetate operon transcriptional repressor